MKRLSIFALLLTLVAGGLSAQTNTPRNLENTGNANNGWVDSTNWRLAGTTTTTGVSIPTLIDSVNIVKGMDIKNTTDAVATSVIVKNGLLKIEQGSSLACPTIVLGYGDKAGNIELSGSITGDIQVERGELKLKKDAVAVVTGNIVCGDNGKLTAEEQSVITGNITLNASGDSQIKGSVNGNITCENGSKLILDQQSSVTGNIVFDASGDSQIKGSVNGNITCENGSKLILDQQSSVTGNIVFDASGVSQIKGSVNGNITCENGSNLILDQQSSVTGNIVFDSSGVSHIKGRVEGNITCENGSKLTLAPNSSVVGSVVFDGSGDSEIQGAVTGDVFCQNGSDVKLNNDHSSVTGNIIVETGGKLNLNHDKAEVTGTIIVGSGGELKFSNKAKVNGDIVLMAGAIVDLKNLQDGKFTGTLIIESGMSINDIRNLPKFLDPNKPDFDSNKVVCAKRIYRAWNFIGLPLSSDIAPLAASDAPAMWALRFNYDNNEWSEDYLHYIAGGQQDTLARGNGMFVYLEDESYNIRLGSIVGDTSAMIMTYPYTGARSAETGRWFALANPYMKNLSISTFLANNAGKIHDGVYLYNGLTFDAFYSGASESIIVGDGFFVNMADGHTDITFNYPSSAKSKSAEREFVKVSVATNGYKVPVMFAQNDDASDGYDIYDANKMFGDGSVAEPYLVCNGINLCKEEVSSTNYMATMNIKSFESRSVEIVADNIPEGYSLTLLDGAVEVEMSEGDVYTTDIAEGENAERFKLLINKNNVSIADVAEVESVRVVNNNRSIAIYGGKNVRTEVYNALGQKVYETSDRTFDLNNVAAGAYVLKVQDGKSVSSSKIVVE